MTQFASTLYPQTNPTNPILLEFRSLVAEGANAEGLAWVICHNSVGGNLTRFPGATASHHGHARRVLTRLAALTG